MRRLGPHQGRTCWNLVFSSLVLLLISSAANAQLSISVSSVNFGNVQVGSTQIIPVSVNNTGKSNITVSRVTMSGTGFSFAGPNLPITLWPKQTTSLSVSFAPQAAGSVSGNMTISYWASWGGHNMVHSGSSTVALSGNGDSTSTPGFLSAPSSMSLGSVPVGSSQTQALTLSNSGGSPLTISAATVSGSGFTASGLTFPYTLAAGTSASLSLVFSPTAAGTNIATLSVSSNASNSLVNVSLTGSGTTTSGTLGVTPGAMNFGSVTIGSNQTQNGSVSASGGSVTLSSASSSNSTFSLGGLSLPVTLAAGQSVPFTVTFNPTAAGTLSANISFFTSTSSSATETVSGTGATIQHIVNLFWSPSTTTSVMGYNVYRGTAATGPYTQVNPSLNTSMNYSDGTVKSGQTYYYVTTAVDSSGVESSHSNQVQAVVPFP